MKGREGRSLDEGGREDRVGEDNWPAKLGLKEEGGSKGRREGKCGVRGRKYRREKGKWEGLVN